jgi:hypothetical protein
VIEEARPASTRRSWHFSHLPGLGQDTVRNAIGTTSLEIPNLYYIVANTDERQTCAGALAAVLSTPEAPAFASDIDTDLRAILQSTERSVKDGLNQPEQLS